MEVEEEDEDEDDDEIEDWIAELVPNMDRFVVLLLKAKLEDNF